MAEKNIDQKATFTPSEIEAACGMPARTIELLKREKLIPGQVTAGGRGRQARFNFVGLSRMVLTQALSMSTQSEGYVIPARLALGIGAELEQAYGSVPFGFKDMQRKIYEELKSTQSILGPNGEFCRYRTILEAWKNGLTDSREARSNDYLLIIVDGEFVGQSIWDGMRILMQNPKNNGSVQPLMRYRYDGLRGGGIKIETMYSETDENYFYEQLHRAISVVQMNMSLAMRKAVLTIHQMREAS